MIGGDGQRRRGPWPWSLAFCPGRVALCLLPVLLAAGPGRAAEMPLPASPWQVTADKISRFVNPASVIAEGHVVLLREGVTSAGQMLTAHPSEAGAGVKPLTISGDWIRLDQESQQIRVRGHVVLDSEEEHITADLADLDMARQTGRLQRATIHFPKRSLYLAGAEVEKTGDLTYHLTDGWATKCDPVAGAPPPWQFGWGEADITQEGFAHFSDVTFSVKDQPVAYTPYLAFPTNTRRKTGLLVPEWTGGSRDVAGILAPLFVDLTPSQDLTLYAGDLTRRGPLAGAEYRYVHDRGSKGTLLINYLKDRLTDSPDDDFKSDGIYRTATDRYWLRGKADHDFGDNLTAKFDLDLVSDQDYLQEYADGVIGYTESAGRFNDEFGRGFEAKTTYARTNTAQLNKLWPAMTASGEVRGVDDPTATSSTSHPWALPNIFFAGSRPLLAGSGAGQGPRSLAAATDLTWDSGYVYYWREEGLGGQRLDLHPVLKAPLPVSPYLETVAAMGMRHVYRVENDSATPSDGGTEGNLNRTLSDVTLATSTIFMRDFDLGGSRLQRLTHMVRPGVAYTYIPVPAQEELPLLDGTDRVKGENLVTYGVSNDFDVVGADAQAWKFGYARLSQAYDIYESRRDLGPEERRRAMTDMALDSWLQPVPDLKLIYQTDWDLYGEGARNYQLGVSYATARGDSLLIEHRYDAQQVINQLNFDLTLRLARTVQAQAIVNHSLETDETSDTSLRLLYTPACWGMALQATTTPEDAYRFTLMFSLEGVGNVVGFSQTMSTTGGWKGINP